MSFHHTLMADLDAAQMSGELSYAEHRAMRQALRTSQMAGKSITTMSELREHAGARAGRDFKGRFH